MHMYRPGRMIVTAVVAVGACLWGVAASSAATVYSYQDTFDRDGNLIGSAPGTSIPAATWSAFSVSATYTTSATDPKLTAQVSNADVGVGLPLAVAAGQIASVTVTIAPNTGAGGSWLGVGFGSLTSVNGAEGFVLYRSNGGVVAFTGSVTEGRTSGGTASTAGTPDTFTVTLDNTDASNPTISISDTLGLIAITNAAYTGDATKIAYVSLMHSTSGVYSNFSATVVPEPASLSVLAIGAMGLLVRRRRVA